MIKKLFITVLFVFSLMSMYAQDTLTIDEKNYRLIMASYIGNADSILYWLNAGANINAISSDGITPLNYAIQSGKLDAVKALVYNGADVNYHDYYCIPPLFMAIAWNQSLTVRLLLQRGADAEQMLEHDVSTLHYAIKYADTTIINMFLTYKNLLNKQDVDGNTPLMAAVYYGRYDAIYLLCMNHANPSIQDNDGITPFLLSIQLGDTVAAHQLLQCGVSIKEQSNNHYGMLEYAIISKDTSIVRWAIKNDTVSELHASLIKMTYILGNRKIAKIIQEHVGKTFYGFAWQSLHVGFSGMINSHDAMWGPTITFHEAHYGVHLSAMYYTRYWANRIYMDMDTASFQYWERRSLWGIGLAKTVKLYQHDEHSCLLVLGLSEYITYGHYRGVKDAPSSYFITSPQIELWDKYKWGGWALSAEYYQFEDLDSSPFHVKCSFFINIPLIRKPYHIKKIGW